MQVNSVDRSPNWRPSGVDSHSTGASRQAPERQPSVAVPVTVAAVGLSDAHASANAPPKPVPDTQGVTVEFSNKDWTIKQAQTEKPKDPPPKPVYQQLLEQLQSMWRASGNAVEVLEEVNKAVNPVKLAQDPIVYPDPKSRKVSSA